MDSSKTVSGDSYRDLYVERTYRDRYLRTRAFRALGDVWTKSVGELHQGFGGAHYEYYEDGPALRVPPYHEPLLHEWGHYLAADGLLREETDYGYSRRSTTGLWAQAMEYAALLIGARLAQVAGNPYFWLSSTDGRVSRPFRAALLYDTDDPLARVLGAARACEAWARPSNRELIQNLVRAMQEVVKPL